MANLDPEAIVANTDFSQLRALALAPMGEQPSPSPHSSSTDHASRLTSQRDNDGDITCTPPTSVARPVADSSEARPSPPGHGLEPPRRGRPARSMAEHGTQSGERTQDSDRTEALSQWAVEKELRSLNKPNSGGFVLHSGDTGFVDLNLEAFADLGQADTGTDAARALDGDDQDQSSPLSQHGLETEIFPENQRFQDPRTPAVNGKKRKHEQLGSGTDLDTPAPRGNPFGGSAARSSGPMGLTQAFGNTQAPSSPFAGGVIPSSDRPSPTFAHVQRSPASETRLDLSSALKSALAPHRRWRSGQDTHTGRASTSSPPPVAASPDLFEELHREDESQRRRARVLNEAQQSVHRQLSSITARSSVEESSPLARRKTTSKSPRRRSLLAIQRNDEDSGLEDGSATESEAETEREELPAAPDLGQRRSKPVGDEDKENLALDPTQLLSPHPNPPPDISPRLASRLFQRKGTFSVPSSADDERSQKHIPQTGQTELGTTIADSQRSTHGQPPSSANAPRTSESSTRVIRESQSGKIPDSSEPRKPTAGKELGRSSSAPPESPSRKKGLPRSSPIPPAGNGCFSRKLVLDSATKPSSSEGIYRKPVRRNFVYDETPMRPATLPSTIPETSSAARHGPPRTTRFSSSITPLAGKSHLTTRRWPADGFQDIGDQAQEAGVQTQTEQNEASESFRHAHSQRGLAPRSLMEITDARLRDTQSQPVDMDIDILNQDDKDYAAEMDKYSSPISHTRRRRMKMERGRGKRAQTASEQDKQLRGTDDRGNSGPSDAEEESEDVPPQEKMQVEQRLNLELSSEADREPRGVQRESPDHPEPGAKNAKPDASDQQSRGNSPDEELDHQHLPRVFAHWPGRGRLSFYPATCLEIGAVEPKIRVRFDYGDVVAEIKSSQVKRLELRPGDRVKVDVNKFRSQVYIVEECLAPVDESEERPQTDVFGNQNIKVRPKQNKGPCELLEFPIASLYHELQTWNLFRDRELQALEPSDEAAGLGTNGAANYGVMTPATKRRTFRTELINHTFSTAPNADSKQASFSGLFRGTVFVLTNIPEDSRSRTESMIVQHGGRVLKEGFEELFVPHTQPKQAPSAPSSASKRGSSLPARSSPAPTESSTSDQLQSPGLRLKPSVPDDLTAFLLTTNHCRNTKYFEALALGVPCLSYRWIDLCVQRASLLPWCNFVLAAGESALLDGATISRALPCAPDSGHWPLRAMLARRPSWLRGRRVLFVGVDRRSLDAHAFLAHSLGAAEVAAARDEREAAQVVKERGGSGRAVDVVVVNGSEVVDSKRMAEGAGRQGKRRRASRDEGLAAQGAEMAGWSGARVLSTEAVMQSLILGRLLD